LETTFTTFPRGKNDDTVDSASQAILWLSGGARRGYAGLAEGWAKIEHEWVGTIAGLGLGDLPCIPQDNGGWPTPGGNGNGNGGGWF
jgi:hypothetical protein